MGFLLETARRARSGYFARSFSSLTASGIIEVRESLLKPKNMENFLERVSQIRCVPQLMGHFVCTTGGATNMVASLYIHDSVSSRESVTHVPGLPSAKVPRKNALEVAASEYAVSESSQIYLEALDCHEAAGACAMRDYASPKVEADASASASLPLYEMRKYQLHPGYGSVLMLREVFRQGLPSKVAADPSGTLVGFLYTDVGVLNQVIELWRYPSAQACIEARQASRKVPEWRECIGRVTPGVQQFETRFLHPTPLSTWQ